jgi:hypothetical protein
MRSSLIPNIISMRGTCGDFFNLKPPQLQFFGSFCVNFLCMVVVVCVERCVHLYSKFIKKNSYTREVQVKRKNTVQGDFRASLPNRAPTSTHIHLPSPPSPYLWFFLLKTWFVVSSRKYRCKRSIRRVPSILFSSTKWTNFSNDIIIFRKVSSFLY